MKILTLKEMLRKEGFTIKEIKEFYKKKERLSNMNIRYTIEHFKKEKSK